MHITFDVSKKVFFTISILFLYYCLLQITLPGVGITNLLPCNDLDVIQITDILSGTSLRKYSICCLNIIPMITWLIFKQLYKVFMDFISNLHKNTTYDKYLFRINNKYSIYLIFLISYAEGYIYLNQVEKHTLNTSITILLENRIIYLCCLTLIAMGSVITYCLVKWINIYGIGKGISCIVLINITISLYDNLLKYIHIGNKYVLVLVLVQCLLCIVLFYYMDKGYLSLPCASNTFLGKITETVSGSNLSSYILFQIGIFGLLPLILANSIVYIHIKHDSVFSSCIEIMIILAMILFLIVCINRYIQKTSRYVHMIVKNSIYVCYSNKNTYLYSVLSTYIYRIGIRDFYLISSILICSKLVPLTVLFCMLYRSNNVIINTEMDELTNINNIFMLLLLILTRLILFLFYKTDLYYFKWYK